MILLYNVFHVNLPCQLIVDNGSLWRAVRGTIGISDFNTVYCRETSERGVVAFPDEFMLLYPSSVLEMTPYFCELSKVNCTASFSIRTPGLLQSNEQFLNDANRAPDCL